MAVWQPSAKTHAPEGSAQRTGAHTFEALTAFLEQHGKSQPRTMLEIASGFGDHAARFVGHWQECSVQMTEAQQECLEALEKLSKKSNGLLPPIKLNVLDEDDWRKIKLQKVRYDGIYCSNLIHISPWETTDALFRHAATLVEDGGWVFLYGAYLRDRQFTSEADKRFDASLKERDASFGLRDPLDVDAVARQYGFRRVFTMGLPSNNMAYAWMR